MVRGRAGHTLLALVAVGVLLALVGDVHASISVPPGVDARLVLFAVLALLAFRRLADSVQALRTVDARLGLLTIARAVTYLRESEMGHWSYYE